MNCEEAILCIREKLTFLSITISEQFNPPVSHAKVTQFKQANRIELPEGYTFFITQIGNGGFGPYLEEGFLPLDQTVSPRRSPWLLFSYATGRKVPNWDTQTGEELSKLTDFYIDEEF